MPQSDLVAELDVLYRAAGRPSFRRLSAEIRADESMPDSVSHETVGALLSGSSVPRWSKVECVVRQLARMAVHRPDPDAEVRRLHALWTESRDRSAASSGAGGEAPAATAVARTLTLPDLFEPSSSGGGGLAVPAATDVRVRALPPSNQNFVGREGTLDAIRSAFAGEPWQPVVLHGLGGVGKSTLAAEYAYRHQREYEVMWWCGAQDPAQTRLALTALAERLDLPVAHDMRQTTNAVLSRLESSDFRWLLVYDNAGDPDLLRPLLPAAGGDVLVTTRDSAWSTVGRAIGVDVLDRQHSVELLTSRSAVSFDEADQLAERLGDLPLALTVASASLRETALSGHEYLARLDDRSIARLAADLPGGYPTSLGGVFADTLARVHAQSPAAAQLLAMLSCLGPEPVSLALLSVADQHIAPPLGRLLAQPVPLAKALRLLARYGLATVIGGVRVQVHRLVQAVVRDRLTPEELAAARANARALLVAADPGDPSNPMTWDLHGEIATHAGPAGLIDHDERAARRVVLHQVRYRQVIGDFEASYRLGRQAYERWVGPSGIPNDEQGYRCVEFMARALLDLGRHEEAEAVLEPVWAHAHADPALGPGHPVVLRLAGVVADARRVLGRYREALLLDRSQVNGSSPAEVPTRGHVVARRRLAESLRAIGDFVQAREVDVSALKELSRAFGEEDYETLIHISGLALDLQGLGQYGPSLALQQDALATLRLRLRARHVAVLAGRHIVAVNLRRLDRLAEAVELSRELFHISTGELGSDHSRALAIAMTYANALRETAAAGLHGASLPQAYTVSLSTADRYRRRYGDRHPLTSAAAVNLATVLRAMGERLGARRVLEPAYLHLERELGRAHPFTHAAAVGLAVNLAAAHEEQDAIRLLTDTLNTATQADRADHPDVLIGAVNLGILLRQHTSQGDHGQLEKHLDQLRRHLGQDHPRVVAAEQGRLGECDIDAPTAWI